MERLWPVFLALLLTSPLAASAHAHDSSPPLRIDCTSTTPPVWAASDPTRSLVRWPVAAARTPAVQRCIDHGVAMLYGFSVGQAREDFMRANALQGGPGLALAWWGIAESWTIDINLPSSTPANELLAAQAAQKALALSENPTTAAEKETRALAEAIVLRFPAPASPPAPASNCTINEQFQAYALALNDYVRNTSTATGNAFVIAGFAWYTMEQNPATGCKVAAASSALAKSFAALDDVTPPNPLCVAPPQAPPSKIDQAIADADRAIQLDPNNPGPHHLGVHARETCGFGTTAAARADADALTSYRYGPGSSHLVHMASHIYSRIGLYQSIVGSYQSILAANTRAVLNDHDYDRRTPAGQGQQYLNRYHTHDIDFLLYAWTTIGQYAGAQRFVQHEYPNGRPYLSVLLRLHRTDLLPPPHPDDAMREPSREILAALSAARQGDDALAKQLGAQPLSDGSAQDPALIDLVRAQIHVRQARHYDALVDYNRAYCEKYVPKATPHRTCMVPTAPAGCPPPPQASPGDPKDFWMVPIGEGYGKTLLQTRNYAAAANVFRTELCRFPYDPHLEWGAAQAYRAMGDRARAARYALLYMMHWRGTAPLTMDQLG
ncbi:MAG: hypothetical protein M3N49_11380 [Candidatus Eremiobacteraeota bacterium]|nr:hypothetical protein [Candidatus Eremiobacteraeota bacterium]